MNFEYPIELTGAARPVVADGPHRFDVTSPVTNQQRTVVLEGFVSRSVFIGQPPAWEPALPEVDQPPAPQR